jgi:hypothetical protein
MDVYCDPKQHDDSSDDQFDARCCLPGKHAMNAIHLAKSLRYLARSIAGLEPSAPAQ